MDIDWQKRHLSDLWGEGGSQGTLCQSALGNDQPYMAGSFRHRLSVISICSQDQDAQRRALLDRLESSPFFRIALYFISHRFRRTATIPARKALNDSDFGCRAAVTSNEELVLYVRRNFIQRKPSIIRQRGKTPVVFETPADAVDTLIVICIRTHFLLLTHDTER